MSWKSVYGKSVVGAVLATGVISGAAQVAAEQQGEVPATRAESAFPCLWPVCVWSSGHLGVPGGLSE